MDGSDLIDKTKILVNEYIDDRLIRSGLNLKQRKLTPSTMFQTPVEELSGITNTFVNNECLQNLTRKRYSESDASTDDVLLILVYIGECLELRHQNIYTDVFQHLNIKSLAEVNLRRVFLNVAKEIFHEGITWGRIVALFAFAGGLTVDCVLSGSSVYVTRVKNWCFEYIQSELHGWINKNKGWTGLFDHFTTQYRPGYVETYNVYTWLFSAIMFLIAVLLATAFAFGR